MKTAVVEGRLFIISACSGAGKTTLVEQVVQNIMHQVSIKRVVTYTSKDPRSNEIDGKDYCFLSAEQFQAKIKEGFFLEWSTRYGHYYGSPISLVAEIAAGLSFIVIVDVAGAQAIKRKIGSAAILIWVDVNKMTLKKRLLMRNTEDCEQIDRRLMIADQEISQQELLGIFSYKIVNDNFENAVRELEMIIINELKMAQKKAQ